MHENKINHKRYIGITCQKPTQRWRGGKGYKIGLFRKAIDKYGWDNFNHFILFEHLSKEDACKKEIELIEKYKTMDTNYGYNLCEGGNLTLGYHHTKESRELMSRQRKGRDAGKNNPMYGKRGILAPMYGKHLTEEHKRKISEAKKGNKKPYQEKLGKKVDQYDINGNFIKTWNSISCAEQELNIKGTHISKVCRGKGKTTGGYVFKYHQ